MATTLPTVREDFFIESPGGRLRMRSVVPRDGFTDAVLMVHGSLTPCVAAFDLPAEGYSPMEHLARRGFGCFAFDVRGYGASYKPDASRAPLSEEEIVQDIATAFDVVRGRARSVCIYALSIQCIATVRFAASRPSGLGSIAMMGPTYVSHRPIEMVNAYLMSRASGTFYRRIDFAEYHATWMKGDEDRIDPELFALYYDKAIEREGEPRVLESPVRLFPPSAPFFDPATLRCPTLVLRGDRDELCTAEDARAIVSRIPSGAGRVLELAGRRHVLGIYAEHDDYLGALEAFVTETAGGASAAG